MKRLENNVGLRDANNGKIKNAKLNAFKWSLKTIRGEAHTWQSKIAKEVGLSLYASFYGGTLGNDRQEQKENNLGLPAGTLTRYSSTRGYFIFTGLEYAGVFEALMPLLDLIPGVSELRSVDNAVGIGFIASAGISALYNWGVRYPRSKKGKRMRPFSLYGFSIEGADAIGRGIAWAYRKAKDPVKAKYK